ncbi:MAG: hypothetical protein ACXVJD_12265 [Mucilaginibacter sp.]
MGKIKFKYLAFAILIGCIITSINTFAQTKADLKTAKKLYAGSWVNKKAGRHLTISFDIDDYATINDWHGKWSQDNNTIDAYKAFVYQQKLVMPEDKTDLRSPYCEIVRQGNALLYRCRQMDTKDKRFVDQVLFVRDKN